MSRPLARIRPHEPEAEQARRVAAALEDVGAGAAPPLGRR